MFNRVIALKNKTYPEGTINVSGKNSWKAFFRWEKVLVDENLSCMEKTFHHPSSYLDFLSKVANGALLYYDIEYGQWGYEVFSLSKFPIKQRYWTENLVLPNTTPLLAFCELYGENTVLMLDTSEKVQRVVEASCFYGPSDWIKVADSLDEWLDLLILNNGAKYWESTLE